MKISPLNKRLSEENIQFYYQIQAETKSKEFHVFCTRADVLKMVDSFKKSKYKFKVLIREGCYHRYEIIIRRQFLS